MQHTRGISEIVIALIDGPVALGHPGLESHNIHSIAGKAAGECRSVGTAACIHGTYIAGILCARRDSAAPAICPGCTLLLHPIFDESRQAGAPSATADQLAAAIVTVVSAGARLVNLSVGLTRTHASPGDDALANALDYAADRGAICVAAAGNEGAIGGSDLIRHPAVIPVAGCDDYGQLTPTTNLGTSIGLRGLRAPSNVASLASSGARAVTGTSVSAALVTGAIALVWSEFPRAAAGRVRAAVTRLRLFRKRTLVPPLLDAWEAYEAMTS
jgi:subtilisin family serine protease